MAAGEFESRLDEAVREIAADVWADEEKPWVVTGWAIVVATMDGDGKQSMTRGWPDSMPGYAAKGLWWEAINDATWEGMDVEDDDA